MTLLDKAIAKKMSLAEGKPWAASIRLFPPELGRETIPTMQPGITRKMSAQLAVRFARMGRWERAPHGNWLSLSDMEELWKDRPADSLLADIKDFQVTNERDWPDDPATLFRKDRLSYFSGSGTNNGRIYLLWVDISSEPEVWICETSGVARYASFDDYLAAYLADDLSAFTRGWSAESS